ncbi:MAG TPA: nucleotidyltransferase [Phycisphaerae bacterium]|nr:nucleotidyltransferase [Phycisphaerae bacterium]
MASTLDLLRRLTEHGVELVVVGGMAGVLHGSSIVTQDVDVCAPLEPDNLARILAALRGLHPCWREQPSHPPLPEHPAELAGFKNLYLLTDLGQIDFLSEISGLGAFAEVSRHSTTVNVGGMPCRVLNLDALIRARRALGRPKDLQAAVELEAIRQRRNDQNRSPRADTTE